MTANLYKQGGHYHVMLSWYQGDKRKQKSKTTGIPIEGNNKRKAEEERKNLESQLANIKTDLLSVNEQDETITKRIKNVYTLLKNKDIDMQVKYNTAHFLISRIIYNKQDRTIEIEYK